MRIRDIKAFLKDQKNDVEEKLFLLLAIVALFGLIVATISGIIVGEDMVTALFNGGSFVVFFIMLVVGFKTRRLKLTANIVSFILIWIVLPVTFYTSGGVYGGTPMWFLFDILFVGLIIKGWQRIFYYVSAFVVSAVCWQLEYTNPEIVIQHSEQTVYMDSFATLLIVGVVMTILISYQNILFKAETIYSEKQKHEIEELSAAQNRFFSSMSHEIRTPINTIIGLNEMILRENVSDEVREDAENIEASSKMLLQLINDILDMSKFESGQMTINQAPYRTGDMFSELVAMFWNRAYEKELDFHVEISPEIPEMLVGDEVRIKQILINLINNAIKYTKEGSVTLSVQCELRADKEINVIYSVTDTGMGIKKESIPHLFTAFRRVDEENNKYIEGTGLGLSIVKQFAELMGGKVTVNSIYTKGSTFTIEIPQKISGAGKIDTSSIEAHQGRQNREKYHELFEAPNAYLLAVDDTPANLLVVTKLLRDTGIHITTANSGAEALEKTLHNHYDVILMDHMMPEMDGITCMHKIREQVGGFSKQAKIVALTANADAENRKLYMRERFDGYIVKPISGDTLEREILRLLPPELVTVTGISDNVLENSVAWINDYQKKNVVAITTESVADIPEEYIKLYNLGMVPLTIHTNKGSFRDVVDINTRGLLPYIQNRENKIEYDPVLVKEFEAFFAEQLKHANNIVHLSTSDKVYKSSYQNAVEAAKAFENVTVISTDQLSGGQGLMVFHASKLAKEGHSPEEITEAMKKMRGRMRGSFVVEDLRWLAKSGEVTERVARICKAFMIHPVITMKHGRADMKRLIIGSHRHKFLKFMKTEFRNRRFIDKRVLIVSHAGMSRAELDWIRSEIEKLDIFEKVIFNETSPVIALNSGPGTVGFFYQMEEE